MPNFVTDANLDADFIDNLGTSKIHNQSIVVGVNPPSGFPTVPGKGWLHLDTDTDSLYVWNVILAEWVKVSGFVAGSYMNIVVEVPDGIGGGLTEATALGIAASNPAFFHCLFIDGKASDPLTIGAALEPIITTAGVGAEVLDQTLRTFETFDSHLYLRLDPSLAGVTWLDNTWRRWYVGSDIGPKYPHWVSVHEAQVHLPEDGNGIHIGNTAFVDATDGNLALTLAPIDTSDPLAQTVTIVREDAVAANSVTVTATGTDTINGLASLTVAVGDRFVLTACNTGKWYTIPS